ncbi:MAG TPA: hypothetical protein VFH27_10340 [Longimicrobiaceae bacterium]|nr:hypothetical protein [Longimicrobiaceae bacterium]
MFPKAAYAWLIISGLIVSWVGFEAGPDGIGPPGCARCGAIVLAAGVISILVGVAGLVNAGKAQSQVGAIR